MNLSETAKNIFAKVRAAFDLPLPAPAAPAAPTPFKLLDGTDITIGIEDPAVSMLPDVGDSVMIAGAPAPAGNYTLADGTQITTDDMGNISVVVAPVALVAPPATAAPEPPTPAVDPAMAAMEARIASLEAAVAALTQPVTSLMESQFAAAQAKATKQDEVIAGIIDFFEEIIKEPTAAPATLTGNKKEQFDRREKREEKFKAMAQALADSKKKTNPAVTA